ncbi:MAG: DoxX family protein [Gemmatimonadaceae bacterium]
MADLFAHHPRYARWAHVLLRVFAGAIIMQHGSQKLFGFLGGMNGAGETAHIGTVLWVGGLIEFFGGMLLILGFYTRIAAFLLAGMMAVAYFTVHARRDFWPILNHGELAIALCFIFLYLAATGAGAVSVDWVRTRQRPRPVMP